MTNKQQSQKHLFSFYSPGLIQASWNSGSVVWLDHQDLVHRLIKVVKVEIDDQLIVFDKQHHVLIQILSVLKKEIQARVLSVQANVSLHPKITFLLPLLKKEALEQAIYSLCEIGVSEIRLVVTEKSRQALLPPAKELERLRNIVVAAAEQSKNYVFPELVEPKKLPDVAADLSIAPLFSSSFKIVFDASGVSFFDIRQKQTQQWVVLLVGPEGGLTAEELSVLKNHNFQMCALTQTTLRAIQAVAVSAALFRLS